MKSKRLLSTVLTISMVMGLCNTALTAKAATTGEFKDSLPTIQKVSPKKAFTAKPLVVLMDFDDYKYTDLDTKEKDFRINNFTGKETTPEFYEKLFFGDDTYKTSDGNEHITVNKFFKEESGGAYEFKGKVFGWYKADHPAAYYGKTQGDAAKLTKEAIDKVVKNNPDLDLSQFDVEDKWDIDKDGVYDEPDGIIDTVVVIHAGLGEEWGGGSLGEDAIWPFRIGFSWYDNDLDLDKEGEKLKGKNDKNEDIAYRFKDAKGKEWFSEDFTVFEQDLPVDLFNHEYGHVLGLPDLYGTDKKSLPPVENFSIMGGSYTGNPRGSQPVSYGAYCKEFLQKDFEKRKRDANWQNSKTLDLSAIDEKGLDVVLDQASLKGNKNDCVRINLPPKETKIITPVEGSHTYFSGKGDNMENWMKSKNSLDFTGKEKGELTYKTWYKIDAGFDFASLMVKEEGTDKWIPVQGNITTTEVDDWIKKNEKPEEWIKRNPGHGITKCSSDVAGADANGWVDAKFDLSQFKGKKIQWGFRFKTDSNGPEEGIYIDSLKVTADGAEIFTDNAEGASKFDFEGFNITDGIERNNNYYLLEWRNSKNGLVDQGLDTINIGRPGLKYDGGLVVWYINEKFSGRKPDQNTFNHPGELFAGVVDADQNPVTYQYDGQNPGADKINYQMHDAAFSLRPGSDFKIEGNSTTKGHYVITDGNTFMNPIFNDANDYTAKYNKESGLSLTNNGLRFYVTDESKDRSTAKIHIAKYADGSQCAEQDASTIKEIKVENDNLYVQTYAKYTDKAYVQYVGKDGATKNLELNLKDGKYKGKVDFLKDAASEWKLSHIIFEDKAGNAKAIYNKEVHKIFGANFAALAPAQAKCENKPEEFKANTAPTIKVNVQAPIEYKDKEVTLLVGIYNANGKMVQKQIQKGTIDNQGKVTLEKQINIPNGDNLKVKVFVWDKNLKPLSASTEYAVVK